MVVPTSTPIIAVADEAPLNLTEKYVESYVFIYSSFVHTYIIMLLITY